MGRGKTPKKKSRIAEELPDDLEDEVDAFHKKRDFLALNPEDDDGGSDDGSLGEDEVYGISGEESELEDDTDDEIEKGGRLGQRTSRVHHPMLRQTFFRLFTGAPGALHLPHV
jgi:hypothetical protein